MEQFKLTVALNRGIDRSDEMARGFTLPLLHPFCPSSLPFFSITAQTSSQLQNSICMLMRKKGAILKPPFLPFPSLMPPPSTPTSPDQNTQKKCGRPVLSCQEPEWQCLYVGFGHHPTVSSPTVQLWPCSPLSLEVQASSASSPQPSLMAPACLLTPRENGKHMLNWARCEGGREGAKHKMLYIGSKPGMSESGPL